LTTAEKLARLWPELSLISCWADATARTYVPGIRELFPSVEIQPKGLLSTECCVSLPLVSSPGSALAIRSHFCEFATEARSTTKLAHEIQPGERYRVIVTTGAGFYRYDTGDWIEVIGTVNGCPLLRFIGREMTSDLVGEKLSEPFVQRAIERLLRGVPQTPVFATLVPGRDPPQYHLLLQFDVSPGDDRTQNLAAAFHDLLCENPYYQNAIELKQLEASRVHIVERHRLGLWEEYERACLARGMCAGDIKPKSLDASTDWSEIVRK
jgi:hypothetical protein